jgi:homoserine O-acetyltransferase/O-succinyltransferase
VTAPKGSGDEATVKSLVDQLAKDPHWNGGWYYDNGGIGSGLTDMRVANLERHGIHRQPAPPFPGQAPPQAEIRKRAETWSKVFDGNSLVTLRKASVRFDAEKDLAKIKAKVLYVLSRTDKVMCLNGTDGRPAAGSARRPRQAPARPGHGRVTTRRPDRYARRRR